MKKLEFIKRSHGSHWVGDGFPVRGVFSYNDIAEQMSPFLLLDYAGPANFTPTTARRGVGPHPHRGFETVTIVYDGQVEHRDSTGGGGVIGPGDVQWMTAAGGIVHEEYHGADFAKTGGPFEMIQLWVNLPARHKMDSPGYQGITADQMPTVALAEGAGSVRVIAGRYGDAQGPAHTFSTMNLWDLKVQPRRMVTLELPEGHTAALLVLRGSIALPGEQIAREAELAVMERAGTQLSFSAQAEGATLLLMSGEPLKEPIVGYGPFVMNSEDEIRQAFLDFQSGRMGRIAASAAA